MTALDGAPAQQWRWRWPRLSLAFASTGVAVVAIAALLAGALGLIPPVLPPIGNASGSPTVDVSTSPGTAPTDGPWPSESGSPQPGASETPGASEAAESPRPATAPPPTKRPVYDSGQLTVVTFRLILDSVPAGTVAMRIGVSGISTPPYVDGLDDYNSAIFCGAADRPAPCVPGTYERKATFQSGDVPALEWYLDRQTASGYVPAVKGYVPSDALVVVRYPPAAPDPSPSPATFSCAGDPTTDRVGSIELDGPGGYLATANACLDRVDVTAATIPTSGFAYVTVDGRTVWSMDLSLWSSTGTQGGDVPGWRIVYVSPVIPLAKGQVLALSFSGCDCIWNVRTGWSGWAP